MRRLFGVLLFIVLAALTALPAAAQDGSVIITWPPPVYDVAGTVSVEGTVNPPGLRSYFLEVADYEVNPAAALWIPVSLASRSPVTDGVVAQWITTMVPDGVYRLRLRAQLTNGQTINYDVGPIRIANTLERLDGSSGGAQVVVTTPEPEVIATPEIIPRPVVINELPIEVGGHISGFNEAALDLWHRRQAGFGQDGFDFFQRNVFRALPPDDTRYFALAKGYGNVVAGGKVHPFRHGIAISPVHRGGDQNRLQTRRFLRVFGRGIKTFKKGLHLLRLSINPIPANRCVL